jgi:hypothetical protein
VASLAATAAFTGGLPAATASEPSPSYAFASYSSAPVGSTTGAQLVAWREARSAMQAADEALAAAGDVVADIEASGLDIGEAHPTVDTAALQDGLTRLQSAMGELSPVLLPAVTEDVLVLTTAAADRTAVLRTGLDAATAKKKAAEEAAAKARLAAAAAPAGVGTGDNSPAAAQAAARAMLAGFGWGDDQFGCLVALWNKESGWNYLAYNASSGATGIPQALPGGKMASAGADWQTNAATQVRWGLGYIAGRYGSPCNAWNHSQSVGWY